MRKGEAPQTGEIYCFEVSPYPGDRMEESVWEKKNGEREAAGKEHAMKAPTGQKRIQADRDQG